MFPKSWKRQSTIDCINLVLKEINAAVEKIGYNNPQGLNTPYRTSENATLFAVGEGGQILGGGTPEYAQGSIDIRKMWKSASFTGDTERQVDPKIAEIERQNPNFAEILTNLIAWHITD